MRRELVACAAIAALLGGEGCVQSASKRAERASVRAKEAAPVRATPTVQRVTIPRDSGRILYDAPTDLSDSAAHRAAAQLSKGESISPS
ncbi:MAG: hypothetical protein H0U66_03995 [Gemmatimonadaceae bacterium]|nr:hypothetical protein [Gemmatimonadaceae bacterium]